MLIGPVSVELTGCIISAPRDEPTRRVRQLFERYKGQKRERTLCATTENERVGNHYEEAIVPLRAEGSNMLKLVSAHTNADISQVASQDLEIHSCIS